MLVVYAAEGRAECLQDHVAHLGWEGDGGEASADFMGSMSHIFFIPPYICLLTDHAKEHANAKYLSHDTVEQCIYLERATHSQEAKCI